MFLFQNPFLRASSLTALLLSFLVGCGSASNDSGSAGSSSSSSSSSNSSSSSSGSEVAVVSQTSSLDWDWTAQALSYCDEHQSDAVISGRFEILRPETSKYLYSSEHFVMRWNDSDNVIINQATIDNALQTFENVWSFYIDTLHFPEPYWNSATKYKVSVNVSNQGYASGAGTGERDPEMWVHFDALAHVGTLAHEFAHTLQYTTRSMRDSKYVGWLWESHANWMAHQFNPQDVQCTEALVNAPHIYYGSTRNRYCNWQFFEFVKDNSCPEFVNDGLWRNGIKPEDPSHWTADPFSTLAGNAAWSVSELNDIFADWALHNVLWDYRTSGKTFRSKYGSNRDVNGVRRFRVTRLQPTESVGEYKVPSFWAPQRWGYNLVELVPDQSRDHIWVDFEGVVQDSPAVNTLPSGFKLQPESVDQPNSSWRWSVVVVQGDDTPRYSELQRGSAGRLKVNLKVNDKSVWLVVMATPSKIQKIFWDQIYYSIYRYPWKLRLDGAKPAQFEPVLVGAGAPHQNGGGWVSATAKVDAGVYVAEAAKILGNARVTGSARVEDFAIVQGSASVSGNAIIKGYALVSGSAIVKGESIVEDYAAILGGTVQDQARVGALSLVEGGSIIGGNSVVLATMNSVNGRSVSGNAQLIGDVELNTSVSRGVFYGFIDATTAVDSGLGAGRTQPPTEITVVDQ